jgi:hypothetical protein
VGGAILRLGRLPLTSAPAEGCVPGPRRQYFVKTLKKAGRLVHADGMPDADRWRDQGSSLAGGSRFRFLDPGSVDALYFRGPLHVICDREESHGSTASHSADAGRRPGVGHSGAGRLMLDIDDLGVVDFPGTLMACHSGASPVLRCRGDRV